MQAEDSLLNKAPPVMISACLLGVCCRYDGRHSHCPGLRAFAASQPFIPFCPEQLGGLPTPRPSANIVGGEGRDVLQGNARLINAEGQDVTSAFVKGAEQALKLARIARSPFAIMKDRSPSCGLSTPYCETPTGSGIGVTAALFEDQGILILEVNPDDGFSPGRLMGLAVKDL